MSTQSCYPNKAPRVNEVLNTLSNHIRREIIDYFENWTDRQWVNLDEIVAHLAGRIPSETAEQLRLKLRHSHLPNLDGCGWIDYDARSETVTYRGHTHAEQWLKEVHDVFTT